MADQKSPDNMLREQWSKASRLTLSGTVALFLLTRGAKSGAGKILEILGVDWSSLNAHAVALLGVPVVATLCVWSLWWAKAFARRHADGAWFGKVVTKSDLGLISDKARTVAIWSLILFVALPLVGLGILEGTFLHGNFYFAVDGNFSCPQNCKEEVGVLAHFWPANGLPDVFSTAYRYDGNLTYVPFWQPILWLLLGVGALLYALSYLRLVFGNSTSLRPSVQIQEAAS
ncbi:hypothetical protein NLM31_36900 [Bradyrhizobium sp. CCGUVB4N]|uniref:hypothetical protein n=1 Tax=Bradyrhizobium sp. CCGUVB4N TaxID=2949631 RepID=UPI0020B45F5B|nr:hypothetical protein [Bradyrhizobium sp. CCGUVB4N]MCP3385980.1 hypothetical protein [Bradyrhizobium sp. CCGUVB4N]